MEHRSGMGPQERGPGFAPWWATPSSAEQPPPIPAQPANPPGPSRPPVPYRSRAGVWSAVLTAAAVLLVGLVVTVSSVIAAREDRRPVATRVVAPVSAAPVRADRMEFVTTDAEGVLIITRRLRSSSGVRPPTSGSYLHIEIELVCHTGTFSYGPDHFSVFDATGQLFEVSNGGRWGTPLGYGILLAGESVGGTIAFDVPRGEVTLLMSDAFSQSVTALKIPD